jgi:hypothetical protein
LSPLVSYAQEDERDYHNANNGPEVQKLCREDIGVAVSQYCKVIPLNIHETENNILPSINHEQFKVLFKAVVVDGIRCIDKCEEDIVKECLEGRNGRSFIGKQGGESIRCCDAEGEDLSAGLLVQIIVESGYGVKNIP